MTEHERDQQAQGHERDLTRPPEGKTHEATTPPGRGDVDEDAVRRGQDRLDQAAGGH